MKICIPVTHERGLDSCVSEHFGSAPFFLIYDSEAKTHQIIPNSNKHHSHGMCHPLSVLEPHRLDAVVCRGMGRGALTKLQAAGIRIYSASGSSAADVIESISSNKLLELSVDHACGRHGKEEGCGSK